MAAASVQCAVVGAGPAGFYVAEALLAAHAGLEVTLLERLPAAYGLARYGVAPDHLKLKQVCAVFERLVRHPRLHLVGHAGVPDVVPLDWLQRHFHAVVLATGAPQPRRLGIAGEDLAGSHAATDFVSWYNGHPDAAGLAPDLAGEHALVLGQGNVALDVARVLVLAQEHLHSRSDIAAHALQALAASRIREVHVVGRRGPAQTKFSLKELRAFESLAGVQLRVHGEGAAWPAAGPAAATEEARQVADWFERIGARPADAQARRSVHFHFGWAPHRLLGSQQVEAAEFVPADGAPAAGPLRLPCALFVCSIGSRSPGVAGLPVDTATGALSNRGGRVLDAGGRPVDGLFVTGWARRGASGVIGSNREDGQQVAAEVLQFLHRAAPDARSGHAGLLAWLAGRRRRTVDQAGWLRIDAAERAAGAAAGRPRVKLVAVDAMLDAAG